MTPERKDPAGTEGTEDRTSIRHRAKRGSDQRGRLLIVYAAREPHLYVICDALAVRLRRHGFNVEIGDATTGTMPPPQDYDFVVFGVPATSGGESDQIAAYIDINRESLSDTLTAMFTVSKSGTLRDHDPGGFLEHFLRDVRWEPDIAAAFAGGEPFPREGVLLRLASEVGFAGISDDRAALRTRWTDLQLFADAIAAALANAAVPQSAARPTSYRETRSRK